MKLLIPSGAIRADHISISSWMGMAVGDQRYYLMADSFLG